MWAALLRRDAADYHPLRENAAVHHSKIDRTTKVKLCRLEISAARLLYP
jgi:hypothetical protein